MKLIMRRIESFICISNDKGFSIAQLEDYKLNFVFDPYKEARAIDKTIESEELFFLNGLTEEKIRAIDHIYKEHLLTGKPIFIHAVE